MKTVKLSEVGKKGWRISPADRLNINSIETSKQVTGAMEKISQAMQTNIDVLAKLAKKMDVVSIETGKAAPAPATAPNVEVIVPPPDKTKKKFRCTPIRNESGFIVSVDIEQL
jgi:hypothetical protein